MRSGAIGVAPSVETRLILIRHGETDDNVAGRVAGWRESQLTERGHAQVEQVAAHVTARYRPVAVYASPLRRAKETADALARQLGQTVQTHPGLREISFGDVEGLTLPELRQRFPELLARAVHPEDEDMGWPNGETRRAFQERVRAAFDTIAAAHLGQTVAIVTHGGVVARLLADIAEGRPGRWSAYESANCSVAEIVQTDGAFTIAGWNDIEHLR